MTNLATLPPKRVVILATPHAQSLEVAGPVEIFAMAAVKLREAGRERMGGYGVEVVSATADREIRSSSGLRMLAHRTYEEVDYDVDTLLVAGGVEVWTGADHPSLLDWLRLQAGRVRRYGSICTGAFVLAEAGLLAGKRATTHWYFCQQLQKDYPDVVVDSDPIFIREGRLFTAAGVTAGIDLAVSLVEEDFGLDTALRIARALVLFLRRPGGQNQFSAALEAQGSARNGLRELPIYVLEHLSGKLTVEELARRVSMSTRNFARVFTAEFGVTPAVFVERLRLETARRMVEESSRGLAEIAADCGFGSEETLRRVFVRELGRTPGEVRDGLRARR